MSRGFEYRVLAVRVRHLPSVQVPADLGRSVEALAADGWELDHTVPIQAKGLLGGSYTDTVLRFFRRPRSG